MPIEFLCPGCSKLLRTPDESAGKKAKCPQCGTIADVPAAGPAETGGPPPGGPGGDQASPFAARPDQGAFGPPPTGDPFARTGDSPNPYASPAPTPTAPTAKSAIPELTPTRITLDDVLNRSWPIFKDQLGNCALFGLVFIAVNMGVGMATGMIRGVAQAAEEPVLLVFALVLEQVIGFLVQTFFQLGLIMFALRLTKTGEAQLNDLFAAGPYYLRGLGVTFLLQLMIGAVVLVCMAPGLLAILTEEPAIFGPLLGVGGLVAISAAIYLAMRFYLANVFVIDRDLGVIDALQASSTYMTGNKVTAFVAGLVVGVLGMLFGFATCCVGFILVAPYMGVFLATIYLLATGQPVYQPMAKR